MLGDLWGGEGLPFYSSVEYKHLSHRPTSPHGDREPWVQNSQKCRETGRNPQWCAVGGEGKKPNQGLHFHFQGLQFISAQSCLTLCDPMNRSTPGLPVHHQLLESTQTHFHWVSDAIQPSHPLLSPSPALNLSQHQGLPMRQLFASGGQSIGSFSYNISPSNEYPGLISFRMDWLDLLAVQGTLKSLLQHHSSKAPILLCSAFFIRVLGGPIS